MVDPPKLLITIQGGSGQGRTFGIPVSSKTRGNNNKALSDDDASEEPIARVKKQPGTPPASRVTTGSSVRQSLARALRVALFVERVDVIPVATHVCVHGVNKVMVKCCRQRRGFKERHHYQPLLQFRPSGGEGSSKKQAAEFDLHLSALMSAATS